jgi:hypothetical protein
MTDRLAFTRLLAILTARVGERRALREARSISRALRGEPGALGRYVEDLAADLAPEGR